MGEGACVPSPFLTNVQTNAQRDGPLILYPNLDSIHIPENRQRKLFDPDKLVELSDSIQNPAIGLLHPVVVRRVGDELFLVAGERRLRAFRDSHDLGVVTYHAGREVPPGTIPAIDIGEMDPLDAWEAELEENIRRADLTWQERANATAQLMDLRSRQAEKAGVAPPTVGAIAEEVRGRASGDAYTYTRQDIILAKHLDDPEIAKAESPKKAVAILKRREERQRNEKLAAEVGKSVAADRHRAFNEDSEAWAKAQTPEQFDVILTDPPYGIDADTFGDNGKDAAFNAHGYADDAEAFDHLLSWFPAEAFRLAKPAAHAYVFCDITRFADLSFAMTLAGWKVFRTPLIWHKPNGYRTPWVDMGPQRRYETILYAVKGDKKTVKLGGDVLTHTPDDNLGHSAQKPIALFVELLSRSIIPGDQVLDLFAGTGPIIPAANALLCRATALERDPASFGIIVNRIKELV